MNIILLACVALAAVVLDLPPSPANPRNSEGDFVELKDGRILYVYSHYTKGRGGDDDPAVLASRESSDGGRTWTKESVPVVTNACGQNVMSVSLLRLPDDSIALFYLQKESPADCRPVMRLSTDEARTWGPAVACIGETEKSYYVLNNSRVRRLSSGRLVLPLAMHERTESGSDMSGKIVCYLSDDSGRTWRRSRMAPFPTFDADGKRVVTQEPGVVELKDGRILLYARTNRGRQWFYYSSDGCETWTKGEPGSLWGPRSPATITRLKNGDLLAIWNDHEFRQDRLKQGVAWASYPRTPLTLAISRDEGRTWPIRRNLADDPKGWYCYFSVLERDDGILLGYCAFDNLRHSQVASVPFSWLYATQPSTTNN